jgi:hypothetical protein
MDCPTCNQSNAAGVRFCGHCGARLRLVCPSCGFEDPAGFRFCGECGTSLEPAFAENAPVVFAKSAPSSAPTPAPNRAADEAANMKAALDAFTAGSGTSILRKARTLLEGVGSA